MQHRLILPLLCCFAGFTSLAQAAPITLDKTNSVADARRDPGTGVCGSIIHFKTQMAPVNTVPDASTLLNKPASDPAITGRKSTIFDNLNFRNNDPSSGGDFTIPMYIDSYLPYSANNAAMPPDFDPITGDSNIAMRVRGYLNVTNTLGGAPVTFAINCDDFCSLTIGKKPIIPLAHLQIAGRITQQVIFKDPGLYPIEMVYAQNTNVAFMELSRALSAEPEGAQINGVDTSKFKLITATDMYSAIIGSNVSCQECGAPGMDCSTGNYCGDGLCQACNVPDHCGPTCQTCPTNARICNAGKCVQCTADDQCPPGQTCNNGTCAPPIACTTNDMCPPGKICTDAGICETPPVPCRTDAECPSGQICDPAKKICVTPPKKCTSDADCSAYEYCDTAAGICKPKNRYLYEGGLGGCTMSSGSLNGHGSNGSGMALLAILGLAMMGLGMRLRRRVVAEGGSTHMLRQGSAARKAAALLLPVFFCAVVSESTAQAQTTNQPISLNAQIFHPALGPENIVTVEGSRTPGKWVPMANVLFEYAHQPLRITDTVNMTSSPVVPYMFTMHLMGGIGLTRWLAIGVDLPIIVYEGYTKQTGTLADIRNDPSSAGVGDLRLIGKIRIIDNTEGGLGLAFAPQITFPTGNGEEFRGDGAFGFEPRFALDYKTKGGFIIAFNVGVLLRTEDQLARNVRVSHQIHYGLGAFLPLPKGFGLAAEVTGATSFFNSESIYSPLEAYIAGRWIHRSGININLGGGPGLTPVAGSAQFRLFASVGYLPMAQKKPVPQKKPVVDLDPDRDGLIGANDRCPEEWGPPENQGCPDIDTDKDGLVDRLDKCPKEPGPKENQGCPDTDRDGDGLVDRLDSCPDQPGPLENNGCPLLDTDKDGIPDKDDKCPYEPGPKENNGCPPPRKYINVTQEKIELLQKIMFATNKADIKPASFDLLNEVVSVMKSRPTMRVHIEGHTDIRGTLQWNMKLSKMRAESVQKYLIDHGTEPERMTSEGYGPTRPLCKEKNNPCYDKNRRTEFVIVQQ